MLNTQRITTILAVLVAAVASVTFTASDATAAAFFADNFDSKTVGGLGGQAADTGQTWGDFDLWGGCCNTLQVTTVGQAGTNGGGSLNGTHTMGNKASFTRLTSTSTGKIYIDMDIKFGESTAQPFTNGPQWWVKDSVNGRNLSIAMDDINAPGAQTQMGLDASIHSVSPALVAGEDTGVHFSGIVNLLNKNVKWKYSSIQNPNKTTSWISGPYTNDWYPDSIYIYTGAPGDRDQGYDNIRIADSFLNTSLPEPATVTLLGLAGMGLLRRRRAA